MIKKEHALSIFPRMAGHSSGLPTIVGFFSSSSSPRAPKTLHSIQHQTHALILLWHSSSRFTCMYLHISCIAIPCITCFPDCVISGSFWICILQHVSAAPWKHGNGFCDTPSKYSQTYPSPPCCSWQIVCLWHVSLHTLWDLQPFWLYFVVVFYPSFHKGLNTMVFCRFLTSNLSLNLSH